MSELDIRQPGADTITVMGNDNSTEVWKGSRDEFGELLDKVRTGDLMTRAEWEATIEAIVTVNPDNSNDFGWMEHIEGPSIEMTATMLGVGRYGLVKLDAAVKDQTEAMPQPVQGGGAESSTPAPPVDSHRHLFCTNHQSMAPVELNRCKEAYYREYSAYGQPCSLYPIESLVLGGPAVKGET